MAEVRWSAQPGSQSLFLQCPFYEGLYHGTRGPGKTDGLLMDFLKDVGKGWGSAWRGVLFRRFNDDLKDVYERAQKWYRIAYPGVVFREGNKKPECEFPTGEKLLFRTLEKTGEDGDYKHFHGWEIPWLGFEELCTWPTDELFLKMHSTCRSSNEHVAPYARVRATANPLGPGHNWVKKRYALGGGNHTRILGDGTLKRCAIFGFLEENKILLKSDPHYKQKIIEACEGNPLYIQAWLYGSWDVIAGGMFDDIWDPRRHVVVPFKVPHSWRVDHSFDWGSAKPFSVGIWAESDGSDYQDINGDWHATVRGDLYRIGEWYGCDPKRPNTGLKLLSKDIAAGIIEREIAMGIHERVLPGPADPSIFKEEDGKCIATSMSQIVRVGGVQHKGPTFTRADNSRVPGWTQVRDMLKNAKPDSEGMREHPGLFVVNTCTKFLELFPVTQRDPEDPEDVDTETEDHLQDEVRYRCKAAKLGTAGKGVSHPAGQPPRRGAGKFDRSRVTWR